MWPFVVSPQRRVYQDHSISLSHTHLFITAIKAIVYYIIWVAGHRCMLHLITPFSHDSIHKMAKFTSNRKHDRNTVILLVGYQTSVPQTEDEHISPQWQNYLWAKSVSLLWLASVGSMDWHELVFVALLSNQRLCGSKLCGDDRTHYMKHSEESLDEICLKGSDCFSKTNYIFYQNPNVSLNCIRWKKDEKTKTNSIYLIVLYILFSVRHFILFQCS